MAALFWRFREACFRRLILAAALFLALARSISGAPTITLQPVNARVLMGQSACFQVAAAGTGILSYQWFREGAPIGGITNVLRIPAATSADAGEYLVKISDDDGPVDSAIARLDLMASGPRFIERFWRSTPTRPHIAYTGAAFGMGTLVVVGPYGTILASKDGNYWYDVSPPLTNSLSKVHFLNESFWAVGDGGLALNSTDGVNWRAIQTGTSEKLLDVAALNSVIVAVGDNDIVSSATGWSAKHIVESFSHNDYHFVGIASGNGRFSAPGWVMNDNDDLPLWPIQTVYYSSDGATWEENNFAWLFDGDLDGPPFFFKGKFYSFQLFTGTLPSRMYTSANGAEWEGPLENFAVHYPRFAVATESQLLVYGADKSVRSVDGTNFVTVPVSIGVSEQNDAVFTGEAYYMVGKQIARSMDGTNWTVIDPADFNPNAPTDFGGPSLAAFGNGIHVAIDNAQRITYSKDGVSFNVAPLQFQAFFRKVLFGEGMFVSTTDKGLAYSWDGVNWALETMRVAPGSLANISYINGQWAIDGSETMQTGPRPRLGAPSATALLLGNQMKVSVSGGFGQPFRIDGSDSLETSSWVSQERVFSSGVSIDRQYDATIKAQSFIRIIAQ